MPNSDIQAFPRPGKPVLRDEGDRIALGTLYDRPLRPSGFIVDVVGPARFGAVTATGVAAGGAISGATTIASTGALTQTQATTTLNGQTFAGGLITVAGNSTAAAPSNNSTVVRQGASAWNGFITKINQMEMYTNPDSEAITRARTVFKTGIIDGAVDDQEIVNISSDGRLNVLGRAQPTDETFDAVFGQNSGTFTNATWLVSNFGQVSGDLINVSTDAMYLGKRTTFAGLQVVIGTAKSTGGTFAWEYWDGDTWEALSGVTDGTVNGSLGPLSQSGNVTFTVPGDWATTTVGTTTAQIGPLYYIRLRCTGGTFTTEPTASFILPDNSTVLTGEIFADTTFDTGTKWTPAGGWSYTTNDYTFTWASGTTTGTLTQASADFLNPAKPNTWYRFRCNVGTVGAATTTAWIGEEFANGKTYFQITSLTEIDCFFKSNSNPGDFVIYTSATAASGLVLNGVSLTELKGGNIVATGKLTGGGTNGLEIDNTGVATFDANVITPSIKITTGAGAGKILTSDADGDATWETVSTGSGIVRSISTKATDHTAGATALTDYVFFVTGTTTITMPTAVGNTNKYTIKSVSGVTTVACDGAETIDGSATIGIAVEDSVDLISNNTEWKVV